MSPTLQAGRSGWRLLAAGAVAVVAVVAAGCGEKSEPAIHPPTTAPTATTPTAITTTQTTATKPAQTPTAPVPKTTP